MTTWREIPGNPQVFDELVKLLAGGDAVGFVGAGASAGLYPLWPGLIELLADAVLAAGMGTEVEKKAWCGSSMDPLQAARQMSRRLGEGAYAELIRETFGPKLDGTVGNRTSATHDALARLPFRAYVTTNYDPALTIACQRHRRDVLVRDFDWRHDRVTLWLQGRGTDEGELAILHAHGQYDSATSLVLDAEDYRRTYNGAPYPLLFEQLWTREQLVVVGFGFNDPWLALAADQALTRAGSRGVASERHVGLIGLPADDVPAAVLFREQTRDKYHLKALFYPILQTINDVGATVQDHSALADILEALRAATAPPMPSVVATRSATETPVAKAKGLGVHTPRADPLTEWCRHIASEHQRLADHFDRPAELRLIEEAWVQVQVRPALHDSDDHPSDAEVALFGRPTTLDGVLDLAPGEPAWNTGRWLLEGPPGSGKTTLLRYLAARLAQQASPAVPIFVSLPRLVESEQSLLRHVTGGLAAAEHTADALTEAARDGRALLLLDGYDEVPRERRHLVRQLVGQLCQDATWSSCRLVVSSRPIGRGDALDELQHLDLLPLDASRQAEFLEKWFRHAGHDDGPAEAAKALDHLQANRGLRDLAGIPLYLTLLAVLWEQGKRPPDHLAALYDEIFELLLASRHKPRSRPIPLQDTVREILRHLAYNMTENDLWAEPAKRLEQRLRQPDLADLRRQLAGVDAWRDDLYAFLRDVHERTQILGPHDGGRGDWRFWHRTFREALTAERLHQQHDEAGADALVEWARQLEEGGEGRWAEPLALLAGKLDDADDLVLRIGEANSKLAVRAAVFAQGLKPETVLATLKLTDDLEERAQVFESIPDQLADADACLALVEQLREGNRNGFDLFWLWWIIEETERRWRVGDRGRELLARFFDHIPPPEDSRLFSTFDSPLDGTRPLWCEIPAGEGWVGSPEDEEGRVNVEGPRHKVEIVRPYWLGAVPVTNAQYAAFDPNKTFEEWAGVSNDQLHQHPRVNVTWYEAVSFCRWMATLPGFDGTAPRLPVEEEWEVACRAGSPSRFWHGDSDEDLAKTGWFDENSDGRPHRVGRKLANKLGLYDVHGNAWEWTASPRENKRYQDRPSKELFSIDPAVEPADLAGPPRVLRVMRGGGFWNAARWCRSACRDFRGPGLVVWGRGFRVLLSSAPSRPSALDP